MFYLRLKGTRLLFRVTDLSVGKSTELCCMKALCGHKLQNQHGGLSGVCEIEVQLVPAARVIAVM